MNEWKETRIATLKKKLEGGSFHYAENGSQNDECALSGTLETIDLLDSAVQILCINIRWEDVSENDAIICSDLQNVFNDLRKSLEDLHLNFSSQLNTYCALRKRPGQKLGHLGLPGPNCPSFPGPSFPFSPMFKLENLHLLDEVVRLFLCPNYQISPMH